jgi:hypothetical protein
MTNRRSAPRHSFSVFFNKFLDGHPYLCRAVDISENGILCDVFTEPMTRHESFPLELQLPGARRSLWVWGRRVRTEGKRTAIRFLALHEADRSELHRYLATAAA